MLLYMFHNDFSSCVRTHCTIVIVTKVLDNRQKTKENCPKGLRVVIRQRVLKNNMTTKLWNSFITTSLSCANALMLLTLCGTQETYR